jgi:choline dehydrogenase-like flavoprotein
MAKDNVDVLIIGSGHSGGMAAKVLTEKGISCVMLNAGPIAELSKDTERRRSAELPYRGFRPPDRIPHVFQANEFNANVWVDEKEVPYTTEPGQPYNWVRVRLFGGRSLFWSRQSLRLSDFERDFKVRERFTATIQASATNLLNHPQFAPSGFVGGLGSVQVGDNPAKGILPGYGNANNYGTHSTAALDPRLVELQAKFRF